MMNQQPSPEPFFLPGGTTGALLVHGFTGSPPEMRLVGDYLHQHGLTVAAPLLPGHGTSIEDLDRRRWSEWTACVEAAYVDLKARCETVFVAGLSLGALLTLYLAAHHPELPGIVLYSPATWVADRRIYLTPFFKYFIGPQPKGEDDLTDPAARQRLFSYDRNPTFAAHEVLKLTRRVRQLLPQVRCPLLIIHSTGDRAIDPRSAQRTFERAGSADKRLITLHNSGHCLTVDSEWQSVAEETYWFIADRGSPIANRESPADA